MTELQHLLDSFHIEIEPEKRVWGISNPGIFSSKSFFEHLTSTPQNASFALNNFIWKAKAPLKVRAFSWTVVLDRVNTNNPLQRQRPNKVMSPNIFVICFKRRKTNEHLFLQCPFAWSFCGRGCLAYMRSSGLVL